MIIYGTEEYETADPNETAFIPMPKASVLVQTIRDLDLDLDTKLQLVMCVSRFYKKSVEELLSGVGTDE